MAVRLMAVRLFVIYAVVELTVVIALASTIGFGWTLLLLLATFVVGLALAGSQVNRQVRSLRSGVTTPQGAITDGALIALGTVMVALPGLVTTLAGMLMLLPPTRAAMRPLAGFVAARGIARRMWVVDSVVNAGGGVSGGTPPAGRGDYIDGEVIDVTENQRAETVVIVKRFE
jgi:UPF0716 protein FxsA